MPEVAELGLGIVTADGGDPTITYAFRMAFPPSKSLGSAVRQILGGEALQTDGVDVVVLEVKGGGAWFMFLLDSTVSQKIELVVRPMSEAELAGLPKADHRSPIPAPYQWRSQHPHSPAIWELFNCVVESYVVRD